MRKIITKIIEAETEGEKIVAGAKTEADHIVANAREAARECANQIRRKTQIEIDHLMQESIGVIQQEKQTQLAQYAAKMAAQLPLEQPARQQAVLAAIQYLCVSPAVRGDTKVEPGK